MNTSKILAELAQWAGGQFEQIEDTDEARYHKLAYKTNAQNEIVYLNVADCEITDLSPLSPLTGLQQLDCGDNQITDLSPLSPLTGLQQLDCDRNQITDLSPLSPLTGLQQLVCFHNQITDLSPLSALTGLQQLDCDGNQITDLSPLSPLTGLQQLDCSRNQITDLSPLSPLTGLQQLDCDGNQITDLSPLMSLNNLQHINVLDCQIINLPKDILQFGLEINVEEGFASAGIWLKGNPLENPPIEVIKRGKAAIAAYFASLKGEVRRLNEVKLILVGEGASGKTSIVNQLIHNRFDKAECMTDGIKISPWTIAVAGESIQANVWDFGGQEIMRATHQLFLSKRCIYLLVLDGRKDERPEYWLKQILSVGSEADIVVVRNKIDENRDDNLRRQQLKQKYPQIVGFFPLSCQSEEGLPELRNILQTLVTQVPMRRIELAENWFKIKQQLAAWAEKTDFISHEKFTQLCESQSVSDPIAQTVLLDLLHDLGLVLHFKELQYLQTQVLNPHWITQGIYALITSDTLSEQGGLLAVAQAEGILAAKVSEFSYHNKIQYLMKVMERFELCYPIVDDKQYLIPSLLPTELPCQPPAFEGEVIRFVYKYESFMPPQVMPRFIVKCHQDIDSDQRWRSGVILKSPDGDAKAQVSADKEEGEIYIAVKGSDRREYFAVVRRFFAEIHHSYDQQNLGLEALVVIQTGKLTSRVDYHRLVKLERRHLAGKHNGIDYDETLDADFSVVDVLNGIETFEARKVQQAAMTEGPDTMKRSKFNQTVNVSPVINLTQNQSVQQTQTVSVSVELKSLAGKFGNWAEDLLEDVPDSSHASQAPNAITKSNPDPTPADKPGISKEINKVQQALQQVANIDKSEQAQAEIGKFERIADFLKDTIAGDNKTGQFLKNAGKGVKKLQDMGEQYNKVAQQFGIPPISELLLGLG